MTISSLCKRLSLDPQTDPCLCYAKETTECKSETADFSVHLHFHSAMAMTSASGLNNETLPYANSKQINIFTTEIFCCNLKKEKKHIHLSRFLKISSPT